MKEARRGSSSTRRMRMKLTTLLCRHRAGFRRVTSRLAQALVHAAGRALRRYFLGAALGLPVPILAHPHFHRERLGVLGATLAHDRVFGLRQLARLRQLLQSAFEIRDGGLNVGARILVAGERRVEYVEIGRA